MVATGPSAAALAPGNQGVQNGGYVPTATPAAPAAAPPAANPYAGYLNAFNASIAQQQGQLNQQLLQSASALGARRDAAAGVVAQLPGQIQSAYQQANGGQQQSANAIQSALPPDMQGVAAFANAPNQANLASDMNAAGAGSPFMKLAMQANYDSGNSALQQAHLNGEFGLEQQQQQAYLQTAHDQAQQAATQAWDTNPLNRNSIAGTLTVNAAETKTAADAQPWTLSPSSGLVNSDVKSVQATPEYTRMTGFVKSGNADPGQVTNELSTKNPKLLTVLQAENPSFFFKNNAQGVPDPKAGLKSNLSKAAGMSNLGALASTYNPFDKHSVFRGYQGSPVAPYSGDPYRLR